MWTTRSAKSSNSANSNKPYAYVCSRMLTYAHVCRSAASMLSTLCLRGGLQPGLVSCLQPFSTHFQPAACCTSTVSMRTFAGVLCQKYAPNIRFTVYLCTCMCVYLHMYKEGVCCGGGTASTRAAAPTAPLPQQELEVQLQQLQLGCNKKRSRRQRWHSRR